MKTKNISTFAKSRIALYHHMLGAGYYLAARAMTEAEDLHSGLRKDGETPEFAHQVWIANYLRTLPLPSSIMETLLVGAFFHDAREDKGVSLEEIASRYNPASADLVDRLTKKFRGVEIPKDTYFTRLSECALAALLKGVDRIHNLGSMVDVFSRAKQESYIAETRERHLPMLKVARRRFPQYEAAFENIKQSLLSRIDLIEAIHRASDAPPGSFVVAPK